MSVARITTIHLKSKEAAARTKSMDANKEHFDSVDMKIGTVELNHSNKN